jgi:hypothetical protein
VQVSPKRERVFVLPSVYYLNSSFSSLSSLFFLLPFLFCNRDSAFFRCSIRLVLLSSLPVLL